MSSMHYCMFFNAASDLDDCLYTLESEGIETIQSKDEAEAFLRMIATCKEIAETYADTAIDDFELDDD